MKKLTKKEKELIKKTYQGFEYLTYSDSGTFLLKRSYKIFKEDRNLSKRELELIILCALYDYETNLRNKSLEEIITYDLGLLGIFSCLERIRKNKEFSSFLSDLEKISNIYKGKNF